MLSRMPDTGHPLLSIITVGLSPSDIISTLLPLADSLNDTRAELVVVTPLVNIDYIASYICAFFVPDHGDGVYQAMNLGISAAKGDYLWFLNSGDEPLLTPVGFTCLLSTLSRQRVDPCNGVFLVFGFHSLYSSNSWINSLVTSLFKQLILLSIMPVSHQNIIFLRLYHQPFSLRYHYSCDFEVLARHIFHSDFDVIFASSKPIAKLVAGGISDSNRLSVFRERYVILRELVHSHLVPVVFIGYVARSVRELVANKIKSIIAYR